MRLTSDLQTEREHGKMLEGQLAEVNAKLAAAAAETERLKEELAEKDAPTPSCGRRSAGLTRRRLRRAQGGGA